MHSKPQNALFAPFKFIDKHAHVSKMGEVTIYARIDGIDFECSTEETLETQHGRLLTAFQSLPEQIRPMFYCVKMDGAEIEQVTHPNEIVERTIAARHRFIQGSSGSASTISLYLALTYEPKRMFAFSQAGVLKISRKKLNLASSAVHNAMRTLSQTVGDLLGITVMHKQEVFTFLRFLKTLDPDLAASETLQYDDNIDHWTGANMITIHPAGIRNHRARPEVLTMRKLPKTSFPNMLREMLSIPGNFILCSQWKTEPQEKSLSAVRAAESHWNWMRYIKSPQAVIQLIWNQGETTDVTPDAAAQEKVDRLNDVVKDLSRGESHAWFSFTAVVFHPSQDRIENTSRQLVKIIGNTQGSLVRETYYAAGPYASLIPGTTPKFGQTLRKRQRKLPLAQCLDLALVYNHSRGQALNPLTGRPALLQLATSDKTVFDFNLVPPEETRKTVFVGGCQGSGKSTFMQACIDHGQKDNPHTLILDGLGGSYRTLTRKHNGVYYELNPEAKTWQFSINPFQLEDSRANRQYLSMFIRVCMSTGGHRDTAEKNQLIYRDVTRILTTIPLEKRRLSCLELPHKMMVYLDPWIGDGQYAHVFDNETDTLSMGRFQCIDFSGLMDFKEIVQPLLFHIFKCWNNVIYNEDYATQEKDMWVDEGWDLLTHKIARRYLMAALRTWRKKLGGVILGTQSIDELRQSGLLDLVNELCALKILLPNPGADFAEYARVFKFNDEVKRRYSQLSQPGSAVAVSRKLVKEIYTPLDDMALWTYRNDPFGNKKRNDAIREHQGDIMKALVSLAGEKAS
jgi:type IV secretion system protein VirB4